MSRRGPDYQKREAKRSLWDLDGSHEKKKSRNKGKGRRLDRELVFDELIDLILEENKELMTALELMENEEQTKSS